MLHKRYLGLIAFLMLAVAAVAQVPQSMTSQAVLRNSSGALVANRQVSVRVSILQGSAEGTAVYVEKHSPTTNANGLYTISVGQGTVEQGAFSAINWASGPYFIKSEADPTGGEFYSLVTTQQLQSVPYALYAVQAGTAINAVTAHRADTAAIALNSSEQQMLTLNGDTVFLIGGNFVSHVVLPQSQIDPNMANDIINTIRREIRDSLSAVRDTIAVVRNEGAELDGCYATCGQIDSLRREIDSITRHYDSLIHEISNDTTPFCPTSRYTVSETACDSYTWTSGDGQTYTATGSAVHIITNHCGADSIITLQVTINHGSHNVMTQYLQEGQSYTWHGTAYSAENTYTYSYTDGNGCASTDTLHLVVTSVPCAPTMGIDNQTACDSYTWINGTTYTQSTTTPTHVITGGNYCGADSTVTLALTINSSTHLVTSQTLQSGQTYTWHGTAYSVGGTYTYSYTDGNGCASTDTLHLIIESAPVEGDVEGSGNGLFTSDANGTTVRFAVGNLQYQASTATWRFAEHQYDFVGNAAGNNTADGGRPTESAWIDLFGWGTSGWASGANHIQPYATYTTASAYMPGNDVNNDLTGAYANADWGVYNPISNGGNQAGLWRTPTGDEWVYIFNTRSASTVGGTANARYVAATVNNVKGIILFPDTYTHPSGVATPTGINTRTTTFQTNTYSETAWQSMESAGCVFLPAAGHRSGTTVTLASTPYVGQNAYGYYWSSTHLGIGGNGATAKYVLFYANSGNLVSLPTSSSASDYSTPRSEGLSVRLVRNSTATASCEPTFGTDVQTAEGSFTWIDGNTYTESNNTATYVIANGNHCGADSTVTLNLTITPAPVEAGDGSLVGGFTINGNGDRIQFSKGNLQYRASTNTWRFAVNQYDFVGTATLGNVYEGGTKSSNTNISATYAGWIDLFGYATSGWNSGITGKTSYQPYSKSTYDNTYLGENLTGAYANGDWGVYNAISNGGNEAGQWRTLTHDELKYLLRYRTNALQKRSFGRVNGVEGLIILPDSWSLPSSCSFTPNVTSNFTTNTYSIDQWNDMEISGAVFLPKTGSRGNFTTSSGTSYTTVITADFQSYYWTSSRKNSNQYGWVLSFCTGTLNDSTVYSSNGGIAVRLVRPYQAPATACGTTYGTDVQTAEGSFTWIDGNTYTESNNTATYTLTGGNHCGGDSVVTLNLTITASPTEPSGNGVLPGLFTVNEDGGTVQFSQGNLQWLARSNTDINGTTYPDNTWRFANLQYDFVGGICTYGCSYTGISSVQMSNGTFCSNNSVSANLAYWIDLFGWGTSGWNSGATAYQPWNTSTNAGDYISGSLVGDNANADWGVYNNIVNGGGSERWRLLTRDEWNYLLNTRTNASQKKSLGRIYVSGTINYIHGMILLPDEFTLPSGCSFSVDYARSYYGYQTNTYSETQWEAMEEAGAVFLPMTGYMLGTDYYPLGDAYLGSYWTSTTVTNEYSNTINFSQNATTQNGSITIGSSYYYGNHDRRNAVRLVRDVETTACLPSTGVDVRTEESPFTWIDGNTYTESNNTATFVIVGGNYCGADSTVTLNLTITQPSLPVVSMEGTLPGAFTVNSGGTQIQFSKGNLQYLGSTNTFRFADHQYDYCGGYDVRNSSTYGNVSGGSNTTHTTTVQRQNSGYLIDLMPYGTSNWADGDYDYYQPYLVATATEYCKHSMTGDYANADWGVYNSISGGGSQAGVWRTPTYDEWNYLLNERTNAANLKSLATIVKSYGEEYPGMIILPDDFQLPSECSGCEFNTGYAASHYAGFSTNEYTLEQWGYMEAAGAVFLPATGFRYSTSYYFGSYNYIGIYWTATTYDDEYAYYMGFADAGSSSSSRAWISLNHSDSEAYIGYDYGNKVNGHAIRLVRNAPSGDVD